METREIMNIVLALLFGLLSGAVLMFILFWMGHLKCYSLGEYDYMYKNFLDEGGEVIEDHRESPSKEGRKGQAV